MLDHVAAEHDVERAGLERQVHRLDVADEHELAELLGHARRLRIELEADDRVPALRERPCEVAARAADVEHAVTGSDRFEQLRVRTVAAFIERDVAAHARASPAASTSRATSSSNDTDGVQPSSWRASDASPTRRCSSAWPRLSDSSTRTWSRQSSPTCPNATSTSS